MPTHLSAVLCRLPCPSSVANCLLRVPLSNSLLAFPYPLPVTPRSRVQNPLTGFAPKQTKESSAWRTSYIPKQNNIIANLNPPEIYPHNQVELTAQISLTLSLSIRPNTPLLTSHLQTKCRKISKKYSLYIYTHIYTYIYIYIYYS